MAAVTRTMTIAPLQNRKAVGSFMLREDNKNKGVFKVEPTLGSAAKARGPWVAMLTSDETGPEHFYSSERECWAFIDAKRAAWKAEGKELLQQLEQVVGVAKH